MRGTAMGRQLCLQLGDLGAHNVLTMIEHPRDCRINAVADARLLGHEINETNWILAAC